MAEQEPKKRNLEEDPSDSEEEESDDEESARIREALLQRMLRATFGGRHAAQSNERLITHLKNQGVLKSDRVEQALRSLPREHFVTTDLKPEAYVDHPLRFSKMGFNISAPHMYAMCLEKLNVLPGCKCLDIGCGTAHFTTLCAFLAGPDTEVHGVDIHQHIIDFGSQNVAKFCELSGMKFPNLKLIVRNCFLPDPDENTYDRIHIGACIPESKIQFLFDKLNVGGILVAPYGDRLICAMKDPSGKVRIQSLIDVRYSDLILPSEAEIKEAQREIEKVKARRVSVPVATVKVPEEYKALFNNQHQSDFTFILKGEKIYGHKHVLQLRSEHFRVMFASGMKESQTDQLVIDDRYTRAVFLEMLKFIYTDECQLTSDNCVELLELSNYYKLDRLKAMCSLLLKQNIEIETAAYVLSIAERYQATQLKLFCTEYIYSNIAQVVQTKWFKELDDNLRNDLLIKAVNRTL